MISDMVIGTAIQFVAVLMVLLMGLGALDDWLERREQSRRGGKW